MTPQLRGLTAIAALAFPLVTAGQANVPTDWEWRLDGPQTLVTGNGPTDGAWRYERMPPGWHVTTTSRGVLLWPRGRVVSGRWGIEVSFFLFPDASEEPLGLVVEGRDAPAGSMQLRFLMRRDGAAALIARHDGVDTLMVPWTTDSAVPPLTGPTPVQYTLRLVHEASALAFSVNGHEMLAVPTGGEDHVATPALRVGPGLNLHITRFDLITPLAPARPRPGAGRPD